MSLLSRRRALIFNQNSILPSGYELAEYIESTGTQWIDTGFIPNQDTRVVCDFQLTTSKASFIFGSRVTTTVQAYTFNIGGSAENLRFVSAYGTSGNAPVFEVDTSRHIIHKKKNETYLDGALKWTAAKQTFVCPDTLELFACYNNGTKGYLPSKARIFSCTIYDNDIKVRDFIPCFRKSDKIAGLFDVVNKKFYASETEDNFIFKTMDKLSNYQVVDYIESTGTQYINTGLVGKPGYTIETDVAFTKLSTGSYQYFAGYSYTGSADRVYFIRINNSSAHLGYTYGTSVKPDLASLEEETFYNIKSVMKANKQEMFLNGQNIGSSSYSALDYDEENPKYIYMFTSQYVGGTNGGCNVRTKGARWYDENNVLVRNFIPCYRKSDGVIGMFDTVCNLFYENQGTGEFIIGGEV